MKVWIVSAGAPGGREGERAGRVEARTEDVARRRYLVQRPEGWAIFSVTPEEPN